MIGPALKINDAHFHLDNRTKNLNEQILLIEKLRQDFDIDKFTFIQLNRSKYSLEEHLSLLEIFPSSNLAVHVDPTRQEKPEVFLKRLADSGITTIKLHPRLDEYSLQDSKVASIMRIVEEMNFAVYICSFWDGTWDRYGLQIEDYGKLADRHPGTKFVWAHFGGHKVLDFMFMLRRRPNVWADISLTQHYFFSGSVTQDLLYAIASLRGERLLFGTDFPEIGFGEIHKIIEEKYQPTFNQEVLNKLMRENYDSFFKE
jgi:predicted TIM-barrel fold metal-dependent hydrolase